MRMIGRGDFIRGAVASATLGGAGFLSAGTKRVGIVPTADVKIRSALLHLGMSMWGSYRAPDENTDPKCQYTRTECPTEPAVWNGVTELMRKRRYNQAIIDLGGGVEFPSHPEITVKGGRSAQWVRDEVRRLADMGIEAIPKLNFSATHDAWLGVYERMLSTPKYYEVVRDLINDAVEMFDHPRFVHLGLDEESADWQKKFAYVVLRRGELWWKDFGFYLDCLEKHNARAIVFGSGIAVADEKAFFARMPKSVVLNLGLYGHGWTAEKARKWCEKTGTELSTNRRYRFLSGLLQRIGEGGYDILGCASNWVNLGDKKKYPVVKYGKDFPRDRESIAWFHDILAKEVPSERLIGGMIAPWTAMTEPYLDYWCDGVSQLAEDMEARGWRAEG